MKNYLLLGLTLCSAVVLSGCKSKESAYRQAYERSKAMDNELTPVDPNTVPVPVDNNDNVVEICKEKEVDDLILLNNISIIGSVDVAGKIASLL